jgi:hypothetical protein
MRLRQLVLAARDLDSVSSTLCDVLGVVPGFEDPAIATFGLSNRVMVIGDTFVEVVSPIKDEAPVNRFLKRRGGDSGYMVILQTEDLATEKGRIDAEGIGITYTIDLPDAQAIHLNARDLGGAILSFDQMDKPGEWKWAGPNWRERICRNVTTELVGADLESDDPEGLANKWSRAIGLAVKTGKDGFPEILLENGNFLRFVPGREGAGEGLVGIHVGMADAEAFCAAAEQHGAVMADGSIWIGGTRFTPQQIKEKT